MVLGLTPLKVGFFNPHLQDQLHLKNSMITIIRSLKELL
jgi:hypothetical protein